MKLYSEYLTYAFWGITAINTGLSCRSRQNTRALNHSADALDSLGITNDPLTSRSGLRRRRSINQGILYTIERRASDRREISNCNPSRVFVAKTRSWWCSCALVKPKSNNFDANPHCRTLRNAFHIACFKRSLFLLLYFPPFSFLSPYLFSQKTRDFSGRPRVTKFQRSELLVKI